MTGIMHKATDSPFDAIRQVRPDGSEFWSARDLAEAMTYDQWRNFESAVSRAQAAAINQGYSPVEHLAGVSKMVEVGNGATRAISDYHLTRFGAYLTVMNGDPRKPEVAAAQAYFAIKTREAEIASTPDITTAAGVLAMAEQFAATARALVASEARIAELAPKAEVAERLLDADGDLSVGDAAKALTRAGVKVGADRLFKALDKRWIYRGADGRWRVYQSAIESGHMSVLPQSHYHPRTGVLVLDPPQPRVTPKGLAKLMRESGVEVADPVEFSPAIGGQA